MLVSVMMVVMKMMTLAAGKKSVLNKTYESYLKMMFVYVQAFI